MSNKIAPPLELGTWRHWSLSFVLPIVRAKQHETLTTNDQTTKQSTDILPEIGNQSVTRIFHITRLVRLYLLSRLYILFS